MSGEQYRYTSVNHLVTYLQMNTSEAGELEDSLKQKIKKVDL